MRHTVFLHPEQNSSTQVGHLTAITDCECKGIAVGCTVITSSGNVGSTKHTVSQPARGHHVRFLSISISVFSKE